MKKLNLWMAAAAWLTVASLAGCAGPARHTPGGIPHPHQHPNALTPAQQADEALAARVRQALAADPRVGSASLTVKVINSVVELGGVPKDVPARDLAVRIAERVYGVKSVFNNMAF
jgi:hypothetical protein